MYVIVSLTEMSRSMQAEPPFFLPLPAGKAGRRDNLEYWKFPATSTVSRQKLCAFPLPWLMKGPMLTPSFFQH